MDVLRTPDERFANLPEFGFEPHYVEVADGDGGRLRIHYLDEGPPDGPPVLLLHGEPTWCYLYRRMIPPLAAAGLRCIAPDLVGFGRSDKPARIEDHTYARQVAWTGEAVLDVLGLDDITLFGHDWGGMIGLRIVAAHPERFARVVASNTGLLTGKEPMTATFDTWRKFAREAPVLPVGTVMKLGCTAPLSEGVLAAYDAPFPDETYKAGARALPLIVPTEPDAAAVADNLAAWDVLTRFDRPFLCAFGAIDPVTKGGERIFIDRVPGAAGQPHQLLPNASHFLQEDASPELASLIIRFVADAS